MEMQACEVVERPAPLLDASSPVTPERWARQREKAPDGG